MGKEDASRDYSVEIKDSVIMGSVVFNPQESNSIDLGAIIKLEKPVDWLFEYMPRLIEKHGTSLFSQEDLEEIIWILLADIIDTAKPNRIFKLVVDAIDTDSRIVSTPIAQIGIQYLKSLILMRRGQYKLSEKQLAIALDLCTTNKLEAISVNELSENVNWFWPAYNFWDETGDCQENSLNLLGIGLKIHAYLSIERLEQCSLQDFINNMRIFEKNMNLQRGSFWTGGDSESNFWVDRAIFNTITKNKEMLTSSVLDGLFQSYLETTEHEEYEYVDGPFYFENLTSHVIDFVNKALEHAPLKSKWNWIEQCCFLLSRCATISIKFAVQQITPNPPYLTSISPFNTCISTHVLDDFRKMLAKHNPEEWLYDDKIGERIWACTLALNYLYGDHEIEKSLTLDFWPHQTFKFKNYREKSRNSDGKIFDSEYTYYLVDDFPDWWQQTFFFGAKDHLHSASFIEKWRGKAFIKPEFDVTIPWRNK